MAGASSTSVLALLAEGAGSPDRVPSSQKRRKSPDLNSQLLAREEGLVVLIVTADVSTGAGQEGQLHSLNYLVDLPIAK